MPVENPLVFLRALNQGRPVTGVTVIFGPQAFLREYALEALRRRLGGENFKYRSFQIGSSDGYGSLIRELEEDDLFAPRRLVVGRVLRSYRERGSDDDTEAEGRASGGDGGGEVQLTRAIGRITAAIRLALVYERDSVPARIRRAAESTATLVNALRPFDNQLGQYAELFARALGLKLTMKEADVLVARYAGDLPAIANALSLASINQLEGGRIHTSEIANAGVRHIPELFEIAEAMTRRNAAETLALYDRALESGRDPIEVLALEIIPQVRRMLIAASLAARRKDPAQIAAAMGTAPNSMIASRAIEGARRFGVKRLAAAHRRACELDASFKMGLMKERHQAVAGLILELLGA